MAIINCRVMRDYIAQVCANRYKAEVIDKTEDVDCYSGKVKIYMNKLPHDKIADPDWAIIISFTLDVADWAAGDPFIDMRVRTASCPAALNTLSQAIPTAKVKQFAHDLIDSAMYSPYNQISPHWCRNIELEAEEWDNEPNHLVRYSNSVVTVIESIIAEYRLLIKRFFVQLTTELTDPQAI